MYDMLIPKKTRTFHMPFPIKKKGIANETIERVIAKEYDARFSQENLAREAVETRLKTLKGLEPGTKRRRLLSYLTRRGFADEIATEVITEMVK